MRRWPGVGVAIAIAFDPAGVIPPGVNPPGVPAPGVPPGVNPAGVNPPGVPPPGVVPPGVDMSGVALPGVLPPGVALGLGVAPGVSSQRLRLFEADGVGVSWMGSLSVPTSPPPLSVRGVSAQAPALPGVSPRSVFGVSSHRFLLLLGVAPRPGVMAPGVS